MRSRHDEIEQSDASSREVDDLHLPEDLACLAEQLQDDATMLASRFPGSLDRDKDVALDRPAKDQPTRRERPQRGRWQKRALALCAAAALVFIVVLPGIMRLKGPGAQPDHAVVDRNFEQGQEPSKNDDQPVAIAIERSPPTLPVTPLVNDDLMPVLFQDASGPEIEGLLDLLEYETSQQTTLSI